MTSSGPAQVESAHPKLAFQTADLNSSNRSCDFTSRVNFQISCIRFSSMRETQAFELSFDFLKRPLFRRTGRLIETPPM